MSCTFQLHLLRIQPQSLEMEGHEGQPVVQLETEREGSLLSQSHTTAVIAAAPPLRCGQRRTVVEALVLSET